jgi:hypothetical protein
MGGKIEREWKAWFHGHLGVRALEPFKQKELSVRTVFAPKLQLMWRFSQNRGGVTWPNDRVEITTWKAYDTVPKATNKSVEWAGKCTS